MFKNISSSAPHEHEGELGEVRFIDTPGFNDSEGKGDLVEVGKIIGWLGKRRVIYPGPRIWANLTRIL